MFKFSETSKSRREGVDLRLIEISDMAITLSRVDFGIPEHGGYRSTETQQGLYADKKSKADGVKKKSFHQSGLALDVYAYVDGKASWEHRDLAMVAAAMLQSASVLGYKLKWGGHFKNFIDLPHFQLVD